MGIDYIDTSYYIIILVSLSRLSSFRVSSFAVFYISKIKHHLVATTRYCGTGVNFDGSRVHIKE